MREIFFHLRDPSLAGLHGEEREHGDEAVVVVEIPPLPPGNNNYIPLPLYSAPAASPPHVLDWGAVRVNIHEIRPSETQIDMHTSTLE